MSLLLEEKWELLGDKALCPIVSGGQGIEHESSGSWGTSLPGAPMVGLKRGHTQGSGFPLACSGLLWPQMNKGPFSPSLALLA